MCKDLLPHWTGSLGPGAKRRYSTREDPDGDFQVVFVVSLVSERVRDWITKWEDELLEEHLCENARIASGI